MPFPELPNRWTEIIKQGRYSHTCFDDTPSLWLLLIYLEMLPGRRHAKWRKTDSPYLRRSPSPSGTHSQGDTCSCNFPGCFCTGHCHTAVCLPSTHQCLQAVSGRQEVGMVKGISHGPPTFYFYWVLSSTLLSGSISLCHTRANIPMLFTQYILTLVDAFKDLLKSFGNV